MAFLVLLLAWRMHVQESRGPEPAHSRQGLVSWIACTECYLHHIHQCAVEAHSCFCAGSNSVYYDAQEDLDLSGMYPLEMMFAIQGAENSSDS